VAIGIVAVAVRPPVGVDQLREAAHAVIAGGGGDAGDRLVRLWGQVCLDHRGGFVEDVVLHGFLFVGAAVGRQAAGAGSGAVVPLRVARASQRVIEGGLAVGVGIDALHGFIDGAVAFGMG